MADTTAAATTTTTTTQPPALPAPAAGAAADIPDAENLDLLLEQHKATVAEVKALCPDVQPQDTFPFFDDVWFLRYVLSFKQVDKAAEAVRKCVVWRREQSELLSQLPDNIFSRQAESGPLGHIFKEMAKYQVASVWTPEALADGGFLVLIRGAMGKPKLLYTHLTKEDNTAMNFFFRESAFKHCDETTRRTRRLSKQTLIFDTKDMSFSDMLDPRQQKIMGHVSKVSSFAYPQLVRKMCLVNAPKWMSMVVKLAKAFLPKSTTDKIEVFSSLGKLLRSDFGTQVLRTEKLPQFLGGEVPDSELPPELTGELVPDNADEAYTPVHVNPRTFTETKVSVPATATVELKAFVENFGINYEVSLDHGEFDEAAAQKAAVAAAEEHDDPTPHYNLDGRRTMLREQLKLKADEGPSREVFSSVGPGVLTIRWNNTHSYFRAKKLHFTLDVTLSAGDTDADAAVAALPAPAAVGDGVEGGGGAKAAGAE